MTFVCKSSIPVNRGEEGTRGPAYGIYPARKLMYLMGLRGIRAPKHVSLYA
jgi:hypothetical protein